MKEWIKQHSLSIVLLTLFAVFLAGQSVAGLKTYNEEQQSHGEAAVTYAKYLTTGDFIEATFENSESEFLQMAAYVVLTVFLLQKGSSESKPVNVPSSKTGSA